MRELKDIKVHIYKEKLIEDISTVLCYNFREIVTKYIVNEMNIGNEIVLQIIVQTTNTEEIR